MPKSRQDFWLRPKTIAAVSVTAAKRKNDAMPRSRVKIAASATDRG
jgi:hypothetical protein